MFPLLFAILLTPILFIRYYELIRYREKMSGRDWLFLVLATLAIIVIYLEKVFKLPI